MISLVRMQNRGRGRFAVAALVALSALGVTVTTSTEPISAAVAGPTVSDFHLSDSSITPGGGIDVVTGTPSQDATCSLQVSPAPPVLPSPVSCDAGWPVEFALDLPGNQTGNHIVYTVRLLVTTATNHALSSPLTVTQQAYSVAFTSSALPNDFVSASCPTQTLCLALDTAGNAWLVTTSTGKVKSIRVDGNGRTFSTVTCPSPSYCVAADVAGDVATWNGTGQTFSVTNNAIPSKSAVAVFSSCSSATDCFVEWTEGPGSTKDSTGSAVQGWRVKLRQGVKSDGSYSSVVTRGVATDFSCLSGTNTCVVVDKLGYITTFDGKTTTSASPDAGALSSGGYTSVSCGSSISCLAIDESGSYVDFRPSNMQGASVSSGTSGASRDMCPTASLCLTSSDSGLQFVQRTRTMGDFNLSNRVRPASRWMAPEARQKQKAWMCGNFAASSDIVVFSSSKQYVGHVTLIR